MESACTAWRVPCGERCGLSRRVEEAPGRFLGLLLAGPSFGALPTVDSPPAIQAAEQTP